MSEITGAKAAIKRYRKMAAAVPRVHMKAVSDIVKDAERQAKLNVTGGRPLFVRTGRGRASIHSAVKQRQKETIGSVGSNVFYMKYHERGTKRMRKRVWLRKAFLQRREFRRARLAQITKDLLKAAK